MCCAGLARHYTISAGAPSGFISKPGGFWHFLIWLWQFQWDKVTLNQSKEFEMSGFPITNSTRYCKVTSEMLEFAQNYPIDKGAGS